MLNEKITFDKFIRWAIITLLVVTVLVAVNYLSEVLLPFFVAWLLAYLVYDLTVEIGSAANLDALDLLLFEHCVQVIS